MSLKTMTTRTTATAMTIRMVSAMGHQLSWLHLRDDDRAGREVLDDHDPGAGGQDVVVVGRIGVEGLGATSYRHHHFTQLAGRDAAGDSPDLADHLPISHPRPS